MRILVTGGAGYLGSVLCRQALVDGYDVRILDRLSHGTGSLSAIAHRNLEIQRGDIRYAADLDAALVDMDVVIHLAGLPGWPACEQDSADANSTHVRGTKLLCDRTKKKGRLVILASTTSVYGKLPDGTIAHESTLPYPTTLYGKTKLAAENIVLGAGGTVLRLATLFGPSPRMRWDLLPHDFCLRAVRQEYIDLYEGDALRPFLHVEDAARLFLRLLQVWVRGEIFNAGSTDLQMTKSWVAGVVSGCTPCEIRRVEGQDKEGRAYPVAYEKLRQRVAWRPTLTMEETLPIITSLASVEP